MINNKLLTNQEKHWLSFMQTGDKEVDNILELQINNAVIRRRYDKYLIFIKFSIPSNIQKINIENGTPIELRVFRDSKPPVQMFLHIKDKYIISRDEYDNNENLALTKAEECYNEIILYLGNRSDIENYGFSGFNIMVDFKFGITVGVPLQDLIEDNTNSVMSLRSINAKNSNSSISSYKSKVITLQPCYSDLKTSVFDEAATMIAKNTNYTFLNNLDDEQVTVETMKSLSKYGVVILDSHGGNWGSRGYIICLSEKATEEKNKKYTASGDLDNTIIDGGAFYIITQAFFEKYYSQDDFKNTLIYLGTCFGGDDNVEIRNILNEKGAEAVLTYKNTVFAEYNREMITTISERLTKGDTIQKAVKKAKQKHGNYDPYIDSKAGFWNQLWYKLGIIPKPNPAELILTGNNLSFKLATNPITEQITGQVLDANKNSPISNVKISCDELNINCITDINGKFTFYNKLPLSQHTFIFEHKNYQLKKITVNSSSYTMLDTVQLTPKNGSIMGRLKEQGTNSPISNREVKIYNENYTSVDKTKTDSNGSFKISLPFGTYTLVIDNDGDNFDNNYYYDTVEMKVNVEANADTVLLNDIILARRENGITGYVYDNDDLINNGKNTPISDVTIEIYNNTTSDLVGTCKTNENGKYSIAVDKNGSYNLVFKKTGYMNETKDMVFVNGGFSDVTVFMKKDTSSDDNVKFAGGDGTEANPYQVSTPEQLNAVRNNLSANYVQINDIDMSDWGNWEPIGTNDNQFVGNYNGQKYKIINLTINYSENNTSIGLFGYGAKSIITNVNLEEFNINTLDMYDFTGSIVGYGGTLINCSATGNINSKCYSGGGLAGIADVIENCTFNGIMNFLCSSDFTFRKNLNIDILNMTNNYLSGCYGGICGIGNKVSFSKTEGEFNASTTYQSFLGGIAGYSEIIKQCYNNANLKIQTNGNASNCPEAYIGGISGVSKEVSDCYNIGSLVTISQNYAGMVGGITGLGYGNYSNCYNVGALNNNSKYNWYKGGIIGLSPFKTSTVNYCYSNVKALAGNGNVQSKIKNTNSMYLTEEQFKDKSSFENFNFGDIWNMHSNANNGYPYLIVFEK